MKIVVLDGYGLNPGDLSWNGLEALGELTVYDRTAPDELMERSSGAEVLITNKTVITAENMAALPALKYIGVLATGYNIVDVAAAKERGIIVTNIPAYSTLLWHRWCLHIFLTLLSVWDIMPMPIGRDVGRTIPISAIGIPN